MVSHEVFVGISREAVGLLEFCLSDEEKKVDSRIWRSILFQFESSLNLICLQNMPIRFIKKISEAITKRMASNSKDNISLILFSVSINSTMH